MGQGAAGLHPSAKGAVFLDNVWLLMTDGASRGNPGAAAIGYVLSDPTGETVVEHGEVIGMATNNVAEYRAVIGGLEKAASMGIRRVKVQSDSQLLVRQLLGQYRVRNAGLKPLYDRVRHVMRDFRSVTFEHVPREKNRRADELADAALDGKKPGRPARPSAGSGGSPSAGSVRSSLGSGGSPSADSGGSSSAADSGGGSYASSAPATPDGGQLPIQSAEPAEDDPAARPDPADGPDDSGITAGAGPGSGKRGRAGGARGAPGTVNRHRFRVRYGETDQMGVAYYANYLDWFTDGRTNLLRRRGIPYAELEADGVYLPVRSVECKYHHPARYDEQLIIETELAHLSPVRLKFTYRIVAADDADFRHPENRDGMITIATGYTEHAFIDRQGRVLRVDRVRPDFWKRLQEAALGEEPPSPV